MTLPLLALGVVMGIVVSWLYSQTIGTRPWLQPRQLAGAGESRLVFPVKKVGLAVFLAVVASLFSLFISAFLMRMQEADWKNLALPDSLWVNTLILVAASVSFEVVRVAARNGREALMKVALLGAGAFTGSFLAGQLMVWQGLNAAGNFPAANPANAFFFMLTAVHGLHLVGGLWVWFRATVKAWRGAGSANVAQSVDLCAMYWHFLLLVWLVLFALLWASSQGRLLYCN
ncbi:MAG: cytochrome c oxidase subunit 3 [Candidatus Sericytochromatia bacterium]|nr:cytochrome c oxidase subunit 3 [Candidatus Tanganyikabacteria bacterium]